MFDRRSIIGRPSPPIVEIAAAQINKRLVAKSLVIIRLSKSRFLGKASHSAHRASPQTRQGSTGRGIRHCQEYYAFARHDRRRAGGAIVFQAVIIHFMTNGTLDNQVIATRFTFARSSNTPPATDERAKGGF